MCCIFNKVVIAREKLSFPIDEMYLCNSSISIQHRSWYSNEYMQISEKLHVILSKLYANGWENFMCFWGEQQRWSYTSIAYFQFLKDRKAPKVPFEASDVT